LLEFDYELKLKNQFTADVLIAWMNFILDYLAFSLEDKKY